MKVTTLNKFALIFSVYRVLGRFTGIRKKVSLLLRPLDAPRYLEFAYFQKFLDKHKIQGAKVLDVSSPYIMSYILSSHNTVIKTDIDSSEKRFIKESKNLSFKIEDATQLSFLNDTFDLVYSVSVIEHIYENYVKAVEEMVRVAKMGGYIYLTFPVSREYREEWSGSNVYEKQHKDNGKTFFQYRFDKERVGTILQGARDSGGEILCKDIYWERKDGSYDELIATIKNIKSNTYINFLKNVVANIWYGFFLFNEAGVEGFTHATTCGNMHVIIKKK